MPSPEAAAGAVEEVSLPVARTYSIGVDIGATDVKAAVWSAQDERVVACCRQPSRSDRGPGPCLRAAGDAWARACREASIREADTIATGVGIFGPVDPERGVLLETPLQPTWKPVDVAGGLSDAIAGPIYVENDANLAVFGEWWQGAALGSRVVVGMTLGTGIGGGIVVDGGIFTGALGYAGEFGHISVAPDGPECNCGNRGCLGVMASATGMVRRWRELAGQSAADDGRPMTGEEIAEQARNGDETCRRVVQDVAVDIARAVLILADCFNPDCVVLCGGLAQMGEQLLEPIRQWLRGRTFPTILDTARVVTGELGLWSGAVGAAGWGLKRADP